MQELGEDPVRELLTALTDAGLVVEREEGANHLIFLKVTLLEALLQLKIGQCTWKGRNCKRRHTGCAGCSAPGSHWANGRETEAQETYECRYGKSQSTCSANHVPQVYLNGMQTSYCNDYKMLKITTVILQEIIQEFRLGLTVRMQDWMWSSIGSVGMPSVDSLWVTLSSIGRNGISVS